MSADGVYQAAVCNGGQMFVSSNTGATWTVQGAEEVCWRDVAISSNGQFQVAACGQEDEESGGALYYSTNYGATWTASGDDRDWQSVAISADGQRVCAAPWAKTYSLSARTIAVTNDQANSIWMPTAILWSFPTATTATVTIARTSQENTYLLGQVTVSNSCGVIWVSEADYPFELGDVLAVTSTETNGVVEIVRKAN